MEAKALVLFSGGQDSTTCLAWALKHFEFVSTIGFNYGQNHSIELDCRKTILAKVRELDPVWNQKLGNDYLLELPELKNISDSALTQKTEIRLLENGLPSTFVPGRNLVFFLYAAAIAYREDINIIVGGMCQTDFSGYPDCRLETVEALEKAVSLGMDYQFNFQTPLMSLTKKETWEMAFHLAGTKLIRIILEETHTCYKGDRTRFHDWGYGCGECPACSLRSAGWNSFNTKYSSLS